MTGSRLESVRPFRRQSRSFAPVPADPIRARGRAQAVCSCWHKCREPEGKQIVASRFAYRGRRMSTDENVKRRFYTGSSDQPQVVAPTPAGRPQGPPQRHRNELTQPLQAQTLASEFQSPCEAANRPCRRSVRGSANPLRSRYQWRRFPRFGPRRA